MEITTMKNLFQLALIAFSFGILAGILSLVHKEGYKKCKLEAEAIKGEVNETYSRVLTEAYSTVSPSVVDDYARRMYTEAYRGDSLRELCANTVQSQYELPWVRLEGSATDRRHSESQDVFRLREDILTDEEQKAIDYLLEDL